MKTNMCCRALAVALLTAGVAFSAFAEQWAGRYTKLPYVESTCVNNVRGGQWVYTDYVPEWNHRIVTSFRVTWVSTWDSPGVFCAGRADNPNGYCVYMMSSDNSRPNLPGPLSVFTGEWAPSSDFYPDLNTDVTVDVNCELKKWRINDGELRNTRGHPEFTASGPMALYCTHKLDDTLSPSSTISGGSLLCGRIHFVRAYDENGVLIHEYLPARDDQATVSAQYFGYYDTVAGKYWPNCGANAFVTDTSIYQTRVVDRANYATDEAAGAALAQVVTNAFSTDHVEIRPGTYKISAPLLLQTPHVSIVGSSDPTEVVIDAGLATSGFVLSALGCSVSGVTVQNAICYTNGSTLVAGGLVLLSSDAVASNCVVRNCRAVGTEAAFYGAGVYLNGATFVDSLVEGCVATNYHGSAGKQDSYGVGIHARNGAQVRRVEVRACLGWNGQHSSSGWDTGNMDGAGLYLTGTGTLAEDCYIHDNRLECDVDNPGGNVNWGAGASVQNCATLKNSLVLTNTSHNSFAGVYLYYPGSSVIGCTIASNVIETVKGGCHAAGIGSDYASDFLVRDCLIEGNRNCRTDWDSAGGGAYFSAAQIRNCVFRGNWVGQGSGQALLISGGGVSVSNCVFDANGVTTGGAGALCFRQSARGSVVRDAWFVNNKSSNSESGSAVNADIRKVSEGGKLVNCFFAHNGGGCVVGGGNGTREAAIVFENCTFVTNDVQRSVVSCDAISYTKGEEHKGFFRSTSRTVCFTRTTASPRSIRGTTSVRIRSIRIRTRRRDCRAIRRSTSTT